MLEPKSEAGLSLLRGGCLGCLELRLKRSYLLEFRFIIILLDEQNPFEQTVTASVSRNSGSSAPGCDLPVAGTCGFQARSQTARRRR